MINKIDEFKNRLNRALSLRNVKPVELAQRTKISESTISQYRSGYAKPKADKLSLIADALDVNPAWLMGYDTPMRPISYTEDDATANEIMSIYHDLNAEGRNDMLKHARYLASQPDYIKNSKSGVV